jgi:hypothetical protein
LRYIISGDVRLKDIVYAQIDTDTGWIGIVEQKYIVYV